MLYDERKQLLFRRIESELPLELTENQGDIMPLGIDTPVVPHNEKLSKYLDDLLLIAQGIIFDERFPFENQVRPDEVEVQYHTLQVMIAIEIFAKEGAEGETSHSENGVSRGYSSADVSIALLNRVTPMCGTL